MPIASETFWRPSPAQLRNLSIQCHRWNRPFLDGFVLITWMIRIKTLRKGEGALLRNTLTCSEPPLVHARASHLRQTQHANTLISPPSSPWWPISRKQQSDRPPPCCGNSAWSQRQHPCPRKCGGSSLFLNFSAGGVTNIVIEKSAEPWPDATILKPHLQILRQIFFAPSANNINGLWLLSRLLNVSIYHVRLEFVHQ